MGYHWLLFHYSDKLNSCDRDDPLTERTIHPFTGKGPPSPAWGGYRAGWVRRVSRDRQEDLKFSAGLQVTSNSTFRKKVCRRQGSCFGWSTPGTLCPQLRSGLAELWADEQHDHGKAYTSPALQMLSIGREVSVIKPRQDFSKLCIIIYWSKWVAQLKSCVGW